MYVYMTGECPMPYIPGNIKKKWLVNSCKVILFIVKYV